MVRDSMRNSIIWLKKTEWFSLLLEYVNDESEICSWGAVKVWAYKFTKQLKYQLSILLNTLLCHHVANSSETCILYGDLEAQSKFQLATLNQME